MTTHTTAQEFALIRSDPINLENTNVLIRTSVHYPQVKSGSLPEMDIGISRRLYEAQSHK